MSTKKKIIITAILGVLAALGVLLLILTAGDLLDIYNLWVRVEKDWGNLPYYFRNYIYYFIAVILSIITFIGIIIYVWLGKFGEMCAFKLRMTYEEYKRRHVEKKEKKLREKEEKIKNKINEINENKKSE